MTISARHSQAVGSRREALRRPVLDAGRAYAVLDGVAPKPHRMRVAMPSRGIARRLGLNRNHHIRVWCDCLDTTSGMPWGDENDPRRLGSFDALGYVDSRIPGSAFSLFQDHLRGTAR